MNPVQMENLESLREATTDGKQPAEPANCSRWFYWKIKRVFDVGCSLCALAGLSPLLLLLGLLIWADDPHGSPIYCQTRIGKDGKPFRFYKFRTMIVGADQLQDTLAEQNERDGPVFKMKNDPRITRFGRFLRKTGLDELPQFWNVLRGEMSIVGPRPALPGEVAQYTSYEKQRLTIRPGLTCYWQVERHRDQVSFSDWMRMDLQYIQDCSVGVDLALILKTVLVMVTGQGE